MPDQPIESLCDELEKLADATKPGSWATWKANGTDRFADVVDGDGQLVARAPGELDASFIARCDPPTVKRLVGELRLARRSAAIAESALAEAGKRFAEENSEGVRLLLCDRNARENASKVYGESERLLRSLVDVPLDKQSREIADIAIAVDLERQRLRRERDEARAELERLRKTQQEKDPC